MKKFAKYAMFLSALAVGFTACDDDNGDDVDDDPQPADLEVTLSGELTGTVELSNDSIYILDGRVIVTDGATLNIEEGTIIKGANGEGANASVLLVARGGTINARGTAANPIIFTSVDDEIGVGEFESTLDLKTTQGLWGGVLILGKAPISADAESVQIEGIPTSVTAGLYGGTSPNDNSGSFRYVSIRFTGAQLAPGAELQGLTLGGVGSGTTIDYVESMNSSDDGVEIFGGTVNVSNFLVWAQDDDGYDCDQGWTGTISNFVYVGAGSDYGWDGDHAMELDGSEGDDAGQDLIGKFRNGSVLGNVSSDYADLRDGAKYDIQDVYFFGFADGSDIELDADGSEDPNDPEENLSDNASIILNYNMGTVILEGNEFNTTDDMSTVFNQKLDAALAAALPTATRTEAEFTTIMEANDAKFASNNSIVSAQGTAGADMAAFGWTYASVAGALSSF